MIILTLAIVVAIVSLCIIVAIAVRYSRWLNVVVLGNVSKKMR